jgi:hypothetical protein
MAKRLVKKGVTIVRDGQRIRPKVGKLFDFTNDEINAVKETDATTLGAASEAEDEEGEATVASTTPKPSSAEASQAGARGGRKTATATTENKDTGKVAKDSGGSADDDL